MILNPVRLKDLPILNVDWKRVIIELMAYTVEFLGVLLLNINNRKLF